MKEEVLYQYSEHPEDNLRSAEFLLSPIQMSEGEENIYDIKR